MEKGHNELMESDENLKSIKKMWLEQKQNHQEVPKIYFQIFNKKITCKGMTLCELNSFSGI